MIDVNSGFWRAKYTSSEIHECLFSPACLGGTYWQDYNNVTWPTACEAGYGGNLCHACVHHDGVMYTRSNKHGKIVIILNIITLECLKCAAN